uniref:RNA polymerase II-associated factor 1 homolog n=1 Tax=Chelonoidis abingdonii TaxID=106734 RepID=A0A8C0GL34_CHEAB
MLPTCLGKGHWTKRAHSVLIIDSYYLFPYLCRPNAHRTLPERSGVVCRVKYCNSLPDIPFDPKFITYPFDQNRFVQYKATSLEKQHKHDLLTEPDLGVTIDLINPDTYRIDPNVLLDPADEKLLEEEIQAPTSSKRSQQHAKVVPWMRKTEYISTEFNRYGVSNEKPEVKIGVSVKQQFTEEEIYKDRDSQIAAIEKTFEDAQKSISQHYSKPRVTPMEVMPVFPDFKMWINPCAQVIFDSDPAPKDTSGAAALEMMSQAMISCGVLTPLPFTTPRYDYKIAREYNWNVKNKASKGYEENYFFIFREGDGVYYNELETRVRLSKRRAKAGVQSGTNAVLVVKHRDMNEKELEAQEARKAQLENHEPEEEEEEEMEMDKEAQGSGSGWEGGVRPFFFCFFFFFFFYFFFFFFFFFFFWFFFFCLFFLFFFFVLFFFFFFFSFFGGWPGKGGPSGLHPVPPIQLFPNPLWPHKGSWLPLVAALGMRGTASRSL